jgi:hypothetical protein
MAEVPLADAGGCIALRLEGLREGDLALWQAACGIREQHATAAVAHAAANWQTSGQQSGAAGRADRRSDVEIGPSLSFGRHAVQVGGANRWVAVAAEVAIAHVVTEDDNEVGRLLVLFRSGLLRGAQLP